MTSHRCDRQVACLILSPSVLFGLFAKVRFASTDNADHFLINPFGLLYSEISASSLVKIDSQCHVVDAGSTSYGVNKAGFVLHSTIHDARPDINAIVHVHTALAGAISALKVTPCILGLIYTLILIRHNTLLLMADSAVCCRSHKMH
jgi:ribulose-5-phosphate 4-epimerase/fuculose-1-phosphate aldolase